MMQNRKMFFLVILTAAFAPTAAWPQTQTAQFDVSQFGAKPDGTTDATAAFQQALDAAAKSGGGVVVAPRGNYLFRGHLNVPPAVTLRGSKASTPRTTSGT
jgi:polygalacturonase